MKSWLMISLFMLASFSAFSANVTVSCTHWEQGVEKTVMEKSFSDNGIFKLYNGMPATAIAEIRNGKLAHVEIYDEISTLGAEASAGRSVGDSRPSNETYALYLSSYVTMGYVTLAGIECQIKP